MVAHRSLPRSPMDMQLVKHYHYRVLDSFWGRKDAGHAIDADIL